MAKTSTDYWTLFFVIFAASVAASAIEIPINALVNRIMRPRTTTPPATTNP